MTRFLALALLMCAALSWPPSPVGAQSPAARVDSLLAFATDATPGCAVAAIRNDAVEYARGYGMADLEHDVPITPPTPFYMASVSKQFAAAAVSLLVLDGKLSLNDDVRTHVPELPTFGSPITIRHLLTHTSGLRDYLTLFSMRGMSDFPITNADFLETLSAQRELNFPSGTEYSYSNTGYVLLSIVVERVSGKSLRDFTQERIFAPLGMTSTRFRDDHNMLIRGRALAYTPSSGGGYTLSVPHFDVVGDGGLFSTVEDMARWEANFWNPRVGGAEWLKLMDLRGRLDDGTPLTYGMGLSHGEYRGEPIVEHGGGLGGYNTYLMRFPKQRFSVVVLCNSQTASASRLAHGVADVYLHDALGPRSSAAVAMSANSTPVAGRAGAEAFRRYAGVFIDDRTALVGRVLVREGKLYFSTGGTGGQELVPLGAGRFQVSGSLLVISFSSGADTLRVEVPSGPPLVLHRVTPPVTHQDLGSYVGAFTSGELGVTWRIAASNTALVLRRTRRDPVELERVSKDAFSAPGLFVRFTRDERGRVEGMRVSAGERVRRIRFDRQTQ